MLSSEERETSLKKMRDASRQFYASATQTGNHAFIEFCGLMNEYIGMCEAAHAAGADFTEFNVHSGQHLPLAPHNLNYINEKMQCIYGLKLGKDSSNEAVVDRYRSRLREFRSTLLRIANQELRLPARAAWGALTSDQELNPDDEEAAKAVGR